MWRVSLLLLLSFLMTQTQKLHFQEIIFSKNIEAPKSILGNKRFTQYSRIEESYVREFRVLIFSLSDLMMSWI